MFRRRYLFASRITATVASGFAVFSCFSAYAYSDNLATPPNSLTNTLTHDGQTPISQPLAPKLGAVGELPVLTQTSGKLIYDSVLEKLKRHKELTDGQKQYYASSISKYLAFLGLAPEGPTSAAYTGVVNRLLSSSLQLAVCDNLEDWKCLEADAQLTPNIKSRIATSPNLGSPINAGDHLKLSVYFTERFNSTDPETSKIRPVMAETLGNILKNHGTAETKLAIYGIDDLDHSMKPVVNALNQLMNNQKTDLKAVFDINSGSRSESFVRDYDVEIENTQVRVVPLKDPLIYTYVPPSGLDGSPLVSNTSDYWIFGRPAWMDELKKAGALPVDGSQKPGERYLKDVFLFESTSKAEGIDKSQGAVRLPFFYQGSNKVLQSINSGIVKDSQARARIEIPHEGIMHNKFVVMTDSQHESSVWTGTTNLSRTCMGLEQNANMGVFIENNAIASTYRDEFNEMYEFDSSVTPKEVKLADTNHFPVGRFHLNKRPNTHRYFTFNDGTEARVHFSPTDDGEHRAIVPALLSAKAGDEIRVAMFGGTGVEIVRAFQIAAARGAKIKILVDGNTGMVAGSWARNSVANILDENPYLSAFPNSQGSIEIHTEKWRGYVHHKTASFTRVQSNGSKIAYQLIVGSQNWSSGGNDQNDENMLTIRNLNQTIKPIEEFNQMFDQKMWPASLPVTKKIAAQVIPVLTGDPVN